jgi:flagellar biosynthesis protein FliR
MLVSWLILFTLVFARVAGLMMTAPIYGGNDVPVQVRVLLAAALSLVIVPLQGFGWAGQASLLGQVANFSGQIGTLSHGLLHYGLLLGIEAAIGACLGLGVLVLLHGMTLAGELVAQSSGLGIAEVFDPSIEENVPLFSRLMFLTAVAVFLCIGGHRMVMAGLLDTFRTIPPGSGELPSSLADGFTTLVGQSFSLGVRVAAPVVTSLLLATLILGLIGRTLPQLNVFALGFSLNSLLALAGLALAIGAAIWAFQNEIEPAMRAIFDALRTPLKMEWIKR